MTNGYWNPSLTIKKAILTFGVYNDSDEMELELIKVFYKEGGWDEILVGDCTDCQPDLTGVEVEDIYRLRMGQRYMFPNHNEESLRKMVSDTYYGSDPYHYGHLLPLNKFEEFEKRKQILKKHQK